MPIEINGKVSQPWIGTKGATDTATFHVYNPNPVKVLVNNEKRFKPKYLLVIPDSYVTTLKDGTVQHVRYYKSKTPKLVAGTTTYDYVTGEDLFMINGQLVVRGNLQPDLLWFLRNHPENQNGTFSQTEAGEEAIANGKQPMFFEWKQGETAKQKLEKVKHLERCRALILRDGERMSAEEARMMHKALGFGQTEEKWKQEPDIIWNDLYEYAEANPTKFLAKYADKSTEILALVKDAEEKGIIEFSRKSWKYKNTLKEIDVNLICKVDGEATRYENLVKYLVSGDMNAGAPDSHLNIIKDNLKNYLLAIEATKQREAAK